MMNVAVMGFGDGSVAFSGAVYINSLLGASFGPGVQFGPNNIGYRTSGALAVYSLPSLQVLNSIFVGNSAVLQGDSSTLWAQGGALSIFSSNNIIISNSKFVNNYLPGGYGRGGALYVQNANNVTVRDCKLSGNTAAGSGGAVFLASLSNKIYFHSTVFSGNIASTNGGAVAFQNNIASVHFYDCLFTSNSAQYGGAVYFDTANGIDFTKTGLVNVIDFINSTMRHNSAAVDGGGLYANNLNDLSMVNARLVDNVAGRSGGAIAMNTGNALSVSTLTSFVQNSAGTDGGAIVSIANNSIASLKGSTTVFSRNTCKGLGGALTMNAGSIVTFNGTTTFTSNDALRQGGAIAVSASALVLGPSAITFINNSALSGSAMYLMSSSTSSVTLLASHTNVVMFRNNVCRGGKQGGTVFFAKDLQTTTVLFGPQISHYNQRVVFVNNTAAVGRKVATQTTSLRSTSNQTTVIVADYNSFLRPSPVFNLVDVFMNINATDFTTTVSVV